MESLSFNKANSLDSNKQVSFAGQRSVLKASGTQTYRFYAPPFDEEKNGKKYVLALELVPVKEEKNKGKITGNVKAQGNPVIVPKSIAAFKYGSFDIDAKDALLPGSDMVGYRFALLDKDVLAKTNSVDAAKTGAYILDSGAVANGDNDQQFSYFSKKQGFVNKKGPMYHIFPDSYNVKGKEDFVRNHFNKGGGTIQGMIAKLKEKDGELSPYEMIISTPLFGADDISSHGYWTMNPYQITSTKGTLEDFKELQTAMFDTGKTYVADGAFTSLSFEAPQLQHFFKWGKSSPLFNWIKFDKTDAPNGNVPLGILPSSIITKPGDTTSPDYKKAKLVKENIGFKVINPKYVEADGKNKLTLNRQEISGLKAAKPSDLAKQVAKNPDYDPNKPTYIQFVDKRLASEKQLNDTKNLITKYDKDTTENHYDISTHQDSVQPFYFPVDPDDNRFKTKGTTLELLEDVGYVGNYKKLEKGFDSFFQMGHYSITTKESAGGAVNWDGNVDLFKANNTNPSNDPANIIGNKQVRSYFFNIASYWTKLTDDVLTEHIASEVAKNPSVALRNISAQHNIKLYELEDILEEGIYTTEFNNNFKEKVTSKKTDEIITSAVVDFPLESVEFAPDLTGVLSTQYITPRPLSVHTDETLPKSELLKAMPQNVKNLYEGPMRAYMMSVLKDLDKLMPNDRKLFDGNNIAELTDYGKAVVPVISSDIMKYGLTKALFRDAKVEFDANGRAEYDKSLRQKGVLSLNINEQNPEDEANAVLLKMKKGFKRLSESDNKELVQSLYTRFQNVSLNDIKAAKAIINRTGAGLNWRFDAAKDVADLDRRRALDPHTSFEDCWDSAIDFWGKFIKNIRNENPQSYVVAEVTDLWSFSQWEAANRNEQAKEFMKGKNAKTDNFDEAKNLMQLEDFGKYQNPDIAERVFYEKTGATTGSNYSTFFGLYPELFGQNYENGKNTWRLYNIKSFEDGLKGFFTSAMPGFINGSHIFVNNHDKPRPFHCVALDMELFIGDLKSEEHQKRAYKVTGSTDYDNISSMGVAVGEKYLETFKKGVEAYNKEVKSAPNITSDELQIINQAIGDLAAGRFLGAPANMNTSRAFGFSPFDVTMKDVMQQARYIAKSQNKNWRLSGGKDPMDKNLSKAEEKLINKTFEQFTPDLDKLAAMFKTMMFSVGVPTLFAGDEMAHSGYEMATKNVELAIRNLVHHEWLKDTDKKFIQDFYKEVTAAAKVHKDKGLSALADGFPLIVPQGNDDHTALYKYNDESSVLVVYSNKRMNNDDADKVSPAERAKRPLKNGKEAVDSVDGINVEYINPAQGDSNVMGSVIKPGEEYKKLFYNDKTGKYEQSPESYGIDPSNGKLRKIKIDRSKGSNVRVYENIDLDDVANVFVKVK